MSQDEELLSVTIDPSGVASGVDDIVGSLTKLLAATDAVASKFGEMGKGAKQGTDDAAGATAGLTEGLSALLSIVGSVIESVASLAVSLGTMLVGAMQTVAAVALDLVQSTAAYGMELLQIHYLTGMTIDDAAALTVWLTEVGVSAQVASGGLAFFARQLQTITNHAEAAAASGGGGLNAARRAMEETADAAQVLADGIADANRKMADEVTDSEDKIATAHQLAAEKIAQAVQDEKDKLTELAEKHADNLVKIRQAIADENQAYTDGESDRARSHKEALDDLAQSRQDRLDAIHLRESDAIQAQNDAEVALAEKKAQQIEDIEQRLQDSLDDIHRSAAEKIAHGNRTALDHTADENQSFNDKLSDLQEKLANSSLSQHLSIQQQIQHLMRDHAERLNKIQRTQQEQAEDARQAEADAIIKAERTKQEALTKVGEEHLKIRRSHVQEQIDAEDKAYGEQVMRANRRYADEEATSKRSHEEKLVQLRRRIAEEDKVYAKAQADDKERLEKKIADIHDNEARQIEVINESLEKQKRSYAEHLADLERSHTEHLARIARQEADAATSGHGGGGGAHETSFEVSLRHILTASGQSQEAINKFFAELRTGDKTLADVPGGIRSIAEGFKQLSDAADNGGAAFNREGEAAKLFGRFAGIALLPALIQGAAGFDEATKKAEFFGLTMGVDGTKNVLAFTKAQGDMNLALQGLEQRIGLHLMPIMTELFTYIYTWLGSHKEELTDWVNHMIDAIQRWATDTAWPTIKQALKDLAQWFDEHKEDIKKFFEDLYEKAGTVATFFKEHWPEISSAVETVFTALKTAYDTYVAPIFLAFDGLAALLRGDWSKAWGDWKSNIITVWNGLASTPITMFDGLKAAATAAANWVIQEINRISFDWPEIDTPFGTLGGGHWGFNIPLINVTSTPNTSYDGGLGGFVRRLVNAAPPVTGTGSYVPPGGEAGGYASGLWEVPGGRGAGDNFPAWLAPGEAVLPPAEADAYRSGRGGVTNNIFQIGDNAIRIDNADPSSAKRAAKNFSDEVFELLRQKGVA